MGTRPRMDYREMHFFHLYCIINHSGRIGGFVCLFIPLFLLLGESLCFTYLAQLYMKEFKEYFFILNVWEICRVIFLYRY